MSTLKSSSPLNDALSNVPADFRNRLIQAYLELKARHAERKHDASGLSAGKLCEIILRLLQQHLTKQYTPFGERIANFVAECDKFIQLPKSSGLETLRVVIPRALIFIYTLRSKRGIGHVGGDVDANAIDGATITKVADWIICELIRVFHKLSLEEAESLIASISSRDIPDVWEVGGRKRVLRNDLDFKQKTLLLLYASTEPAVLTEDLFSWTKYSAESMYKKSVLLPLDRANLIDYDRETESVVISPLGIKAVEETIVLSSLGTASKNIGKKNRKRK